nr:MAG TPA: Terminase small subunit [Caudoviricetes sp.]
MAINLHTGKPDRRSKFRRTKPNPKQRAFCELVARGETYREAYRKVYGSISSSGLNTVLSSRRIKSFIRTLKECQHGKG